jgi:hypothetical protein
VALRVHAAIAGLNKAAQYSMRVSKLRVPPITRLRFLVICLN